uniref:Thioredoxin domain-containing protein n=1 Tax=Gouania willdenowi TaxID=441366 RepID=A0A8C5NFS3_GOUWI
MMKELLIFQKYLTFSHSVQEELKKLCVENELVAVEFMATWCSPWKIMAPVFELSYKYTNVTFLRVNIDEVDVKEGIRSIPAFQFYKGGERVGPNTKQKAHFFNNMAGQCNLYSCLYL